MTEQQQQHRLQQEHGIPSEGEVGPRRSPWRRQEQTRILLTAGESSEAAGNRA